jgi:hypothetical protein
MIYSHCPRILERRQGQWVEWDVWYRKGEICIRNFDQWTSREGTPSGLGVNDRALLIHHWFFHYIELRLVVHTLQCIVPEWLMKRKGYYWKCSWPHLWYFGFFFVVTEGTHKKPWRSPECVYEFHTILRTNRTCFPDSVCRLVFVMDTVVSFLPFCSY